MGVFCTISRRIGLDTNKHWVIPCEDASHDVVLNSTSGTGWANVEYRTYQFTNEEGDDASLAETAHSKEARRGTEKPLTKTEQMELKETAQKIWEAGKVHPLQAKA